MNEPKLKYKVSWVGGFLIAAVAIIGDLLQILLSLTVALSPLNIIITIIVDGAVFFYFLIVGVPFLKGKRAMGRIGSVITSAVVELIPIVDALPTLTINVLYSIHSSRKEDKEAFAEEHAKWVEAETKRQKELAYAQAVYTREMGRIQAEFRARQEAEVGEMEDA